MASRENQSYVIAIIALSIIAVLLLVSTVYVSVRLNDAHDKMVVAQEDSTYNQALAQAFENKANLLAACVGVEGKGASEIPQFASQIVGKKSLVEAGRQDSIQQIADSADAILEIYNKDMAFNSAITDDGEVANDVGMTYKGTVDKMAAALRSSTENAFGKTREAERVRSETAQQIAALNTKLEERSKALEQSEEALAAEKERNANAEKALTQQAISLQSEMTDARDEFDDQKLVLENRVGQLVQDNNELAEKNASLKDKVNEYEREVFDMADGEIVRTARGSDSVFIDLGTLDGVRANLTFVVYDRLATDFEKGRHKAMIEVTEVLGPRLSKARVTEEDPLNPILTKDQILSATFDRGDAVNIALAGFFDLDGDGFSDVEKLKQKIIRNGGRVVASHDEDGNITGEIDSTTRFLVLGPTPKTGIRAVSNAMEEMKKQAEGNSVDVIDIRKLQTWMGVHNRAKIERMDERIGSSSTFQPRSPDGQ